MKYYPVTPKGSKIEMGLTMQHQISKSKIPMFCLHNCTINTVMSKNTIHIYNTSKLKTFLYLNEKLWKFLRIDTMQVIFFFR